MAPTFHKCTSVTDKTTSFNALIDTSHYSVFNFTDSDTNKSIGGTNPPIRVLGRGFVVLFLCVFELSNILHILSLELPYSNWLNMLWFVVPLLIGFGTCLWFDKIINTCEVKIYVFAQQLKFGGLDQTNLGFIFLFGCIKNWINNNDVFLLVTWNQTVFLLLFFAIDFYFVLLC